MAAAQNNYINIDKIAELKGLKSNRTLRIAINNEKYKARKVPVKGGYTYEILFSSLEPEIQEKLIDEEIKSYSLVLVDNKKSEFKTEKLKLEALAKVDIIKAVKELKAKCRTQKEADFTFLELYNSGEYLKDVYKIIGKVSARSTLLRWIKTYEENGEKWESLIPKYKCTSALEVNTELSKEEIEQFEKFLFHPNKFKISKAIALSKFCLQKKGFETLHSDMTYRRYAEKIKSTKYDKWVLFREGEKAFNDKVEPYIERDITALEVGDVLIADGHTLNFQVLNPFTGKAQRATLVGFLDWKSGALVGYEIMMSENTQCIASALRNAILNLGRFPKIVYQDNGRAFRAKYFQNCNCLVGDVKRARSSKAADSSPLSPIRFDESGFNGVYANHGIKSVFAKVRNAKAKVIERFFLEFQEEFEKMMPSYIGTSIEEKPARLMRGENLHKAHYFKTTSCQIPTVQQVIKCLDFWLNYHNSKPCSNVPGMTIKEVLNTVQRQDIDKNLLNDLMMKTETKVIHRNGVRFLGNNYYNEALFGLREPVYVRYSLFDLSKVHVYTVKGEFICIARKVEKIHPMANHLGLPDDMERLKNITQKHKRLKNKAVKEFKKYFDIETTGILEIEPEGVNERENLKPQKQPKKRKQTAREQQMNKPIFADEIECFEWLMKHGTTCSEDRIFLENFFKSDQYNLLYGD